MVLPKPETACHSSRIVPRPGKRILTQPRNCISPARKAFGLGAEAPGRLPSAFACGDPLPFLCRWAAGVSPFLRSHCAAVRLRLCRGGRGGGEGGCPSGMAFASLFLFCALLRIRARRTRWRLVTSRDPLPGYDPGNRVTPANSSYSPPAY
jgi:hypothetical protein